MNKRVVAGVAALLIGGGAALVGPAVANADDPTPTGEHGIELSDEQVLRYGPPHTSGPPADAYDVPLGG